MSIDAEITLIGCLLASPEYALRAIPSQLTGDKFQQEQLGDAFDKIQQQCSEGSFNPTAFILKYQGEDRAIMQDALTKSFGVISAEPFAELILESYQLRCMHELANHILAGSESQPLLEYTTQVMDSLLGENRRTHFTERQVAERVLRNVTERKEPQSTGLKKLDECMGGGLYAGKVYGVFARKKVGKTAFAATISHNLVEQSCKHTFICGEMGSSEIHERVLARRLNVFPSAFRTEFGRTENFRDRLVQEVARTKGFVHYEDVPGVTFKQLKRICATASKKTKSKGIILDYLQLVQGQKSGESFATHMDNVSQWLAEFVRKNDMWCIVLGQINQEGNVRGGEGIRLACDQAYELKRMNDDPTTPFAWMEMMDTRYTKWQNVGEQAYAGLELIEMGPYFVEL